MFRNNFFLCILICGVLSAEAQQRVNPGQEKTGLAAVLENDQRLLGELGRRQMMSLLEHAFERSNVPPDQRKVYLTVASLRQLVDGASKMPMRQQQELVSNVAAGIEQVLVATNESERLMELAATLIRAGTIRPVNTLEYCGENTRTQAQLRPIAAAIDRMYDKAIQIGQARATDLENRFTNANDPRIKDWEKMMQLVGTARLTSAFNKYALALSMDRADAQRAKVAEDAIKVLTEFEDPEYGVRAQARTGIGKLLIVMGSKESIELGKKKLAEVLADEQAQWNQKFEAVYFTALADLAARNVAGSRQGLEAVRKWLTDNPSPAPELLRSTSAAVQMLDYRIHSTEAETAAGPAAADANAKAIALLQNLLRERPDLSSIINEQLIARLPETPEVKSLNPLLLRALVGRGDEEIRKPENEPADRRALNQAILAARELVTRAGKEGVTLEDAELASLGLPLFSARLGNDVEAADGFLNFVEKYRNHPQRMQFALDSAEATIGKLQRDRPDLEATGRLYLRFLQLATAPPFNRSEYAFDFARLLIERNTAEMQGNYSDSHRGQMLHSAERAANLFRQVLAGPRQLYARYFEMVALNQAITLLPAKDPKITEHIRTIQNIAAEVNAMIDRELSAGADRTTVGGASPATKEQLRLYKARTALLAAGLGEHDQTASRPQSLSRSLELLSTFEQDVQGLAQADALIGDALFIRVSALMSLRRADEALANLGKALDARPGDDGIRLVIEMLETLNKEFDQARQDRNDERARELAAARATVSRYLVDRAAKSADAKQRELLPQYRRFEADTLLTASRLETDETRRRKYITDAIAIFEEAAKAAPGDRSLPLKIAKAQYELGDYAVTRPVLLEYLTNRWLGNPKIQETTPAGTQFVDNHAYWEGMLMLLDSNARLAKAGAANLPPNLLEETQTQLKRLYIQWGRPGGARWEARFDQLRQEILPGWTPAGRGDARDAADKLTFKGLSPGFDSAGRPPRVPAVPPE